MGIAGHALNPLFSAFGDELAEQTTLGAGAGFGSLAVSLTASGEAAATRLSQLYTDSYGTHGKVARLAVKLAEHFEHQAFRLTVEESVEPGRPRLQVGWQGDWTGEQLMALLSKVRVDEAVLAQAAGLFDALGVENVTGFGFRIDPGGPPEFLVTSAHAFGPDELPDFQGRLDAAMGLLGVSDKQREYVRDTAGSFAPRPVNRVHLSSVIAHERLVPELLVAYPIVPVPLVLRVLSQFAPQEGSGLRLGSMTAAMGIEEEIVSEFTVTARDSEPPGLSFELTSQGMPGVADA